MPGPRCPILAVSCGSPPEPCALIFTLPILLLVIHLVSMALAAAAVGARVAEVRFFFGPGLVLRPAAPRITVGVVPLGGFVRCHGQGEADPESEGRFESLPAWRRAVVFLSGNVSLLALACVLLGPGEALASVARLPGQLLGLTDPRGAAQDTLTSLLALGHGPLPLALGVLAAKLGAFNLLPLATLNGWALVRMALPAALAKKLEIPWSLLSILLTLALSALGLFALVIRWAK